MFAALKGGHELRSRRNIIFLSPEKIKSREKERGSPPFVFRPFFPLEKSGDS
jgi:hypothetical protein